MKKYNILFASHPDYSGNSKALYEYMKANFPEANLYWVIYDDSNYDLLKKNNVECYVYGSAEFTKLFETIDIVFFTHDELIDMKRPNQVFIFLLHGCAGKKFGYLLEKEQRAPQDEKFLELMKNNIDYVMSPSELWNILLHYGFDIAYEKIIQKGMPRIDYIHSTDGKANLKKCGIDVYSYDKVFMYLPTFRNGLGRENDGYFSDNILNIDKYEEDKLEQFLEDNNYLFIVKYHPYETNKKDITNFKNIVVLDDSIMTKNLITLTEIINGVDLIVTDYSSAFSEFLILDRPVCFLQNDIKMFKKNRGITFDNVKFWSPGPFIKNFNDFKIETKKLIEDKSYYQEERQNYVNINFSTNTKNCSSDIVDYLFKKKNIDKVMTKKRDVVDSKLLQLYDENLKLKNIIEKNEWNRLQEENKMLDSELRDLKDRVYKSETKLKEIYSYRLWKVFEKIQKIIHR